MRTVRLRYRTALYSVALLRYIYFSRKIGMHLGVRKSQKFEKFEFAFCLTISSPAGHDKQLRERIIHFEPIWGELWSEMQIHFFVIFGHI